MHEEVEVQLKKS